MGEMRFSSIIEHAKPTHSGWYRVDCPFCFSRVGKADRKRSLGLRADTGFWHCFRCGAVGRTGEDDLRDFPLFEVREEDPEALAPPPGFYSFASEPGRSAEVLAGGRDLLRRRGVPDAIVAEVGIGGCAGGKYAGRVVVPVRASTGDWVGFVARDWSGLSERKYLYPRGMQKGLVLFNERALLVETDAPAFAVEGVFDAFSVWPDGVAFLGKPTEDQIGALVAARRPIVLLLDGDAHREGWALAMRLRLAGQRSGSIRLPPRTDPDEVRNDALHVAALEALSAISGEAIYTDAMA